MVLLQLSVMCFRGFLAGRVNRTVAELGIVSVTIEYEFGNKTVN